MDAAKPDLGSSDNPYQFLYCGYMVTYISLQLAFFMGCKNVFLLGVDFIYSLTHKEAIPFHMEGAIRKIISCLTILSLANYAMCPRQIVPDKS